MYQNFKVMDDSLWELQDKIDEYVQNNMWSPEYPTLVYKKE